MDRRDLARAIHQRSHLTGEFVLRSGQVSREYFDKYRFESDPPLLRAIAQALASILPEESDVLAGLELGGVPLAAVLSQVTGVPTCFVRKAPKAYGTRRVAEGAEVDGARVVVVEDVITSGGQVAASTEDLRMLGATVEHAVCVIDREAGGADALAEVGVVLRPLFRMSELKAAVAG